MTLYPVQDVALTALALISGVVSVASLFFWMGRVVERDRVRSLIEDCQRARWSHSLSRLSVGLESGKLPREDV